MMKATSGTPIESLNYFLLKHYLGLLFNSEAYFQIEIPVLFAALLC